MIIINSYEALFIIIIIPSKFFTPAITDGFSPEFEWQEVSSILRDFS